MIKKLSFLALAVIVIFPAASQKSEKRDLSEFSGIKVGGGVDLYITQSDEFDVEVITDGDLDDIETEVSRGILTIQQRSSSWFSWNDQTEVRVSMPYLEYLSAGGGSDVVSRGTFRGDDFELDAGGGSDVELSLRFKNITVDCSGGSDVELEGETNFLELETSGGSDFDGGNLIAREAEIDTNGGSDATVYVEERIRARASGASDITYKGSPKYVDVSSSGGADINKGK